jgi:molecular chaperone DnaK (HSP70)
MKYLKKFGYQAKEEVLKRNRNGVLLINFKLLLARDFDNEVDDGLLKKLNDNTTVDAITNYIHDFAEEGIKRMAKKEKETIDKTRLGYVVTVPAMWSDEAKNTMAVAVRKAGIVTLKENEKLEERVIFITEAEAAALYCQEFFKNEFQMTKDQRFMICDCGGGTADLVTFQVSQESEGEKKLAIMELTSGDGDHCGSAYIDQHFSSYLLKRLRDSGIQYDDGGIQETLEHFIKEIKVINRYTIIILVF